MSSRRVSAALAFFGAVRSDPALADTLRAAGPAVNLDEVVELAGRAGFDTDAAGLREAFVHDWWMRRFRHGGIC